MNPQPDQQAASQFNKFVDDLIDQKFAQQTQELTPEVREELKKDVFKRIDEFIMARVIAALSDEEVQQLENLLKEGKSRQDVQNFAADHIPDFTTFVADAFLEFRSIYLGTS